MTEHATCPEESLPPIRRLPLVLMTFVWFAATATGLLLIVPKFGEVFRQVKVPMPGLTLWVFSIAETCCAYPILLAAVMTAVPASIHAWPPRVVSVGRVAIPVFFLLMWGWMIYGLFLPLVGCHLSIGPRR